ncbi:FtsX-like permease family protein [Microbacterium sp. G2-8]|uniref:FtsX-like permease family protein n=1 Tax=Microbacterium sp. G2-8 TaxID=2842454 RepID=UPI001C88ECBA|nr:FtsX-like permease family protein [Microbacterium sp. G2-8]
MTGTVSGPRVTRDTWEGESRPAADDLPRGSFVARWSLAWRMAWRQVRRSWPSSLLIAALVFLPMAGVSAAAVYSASLEPTPGEQATVELGHADAWATTLGGSDPTQRQYLDEPHWVEVDTDPETGDPVNEPGPLPDDPRALLPADDVLALTTTTSIVETADGLTSMTTTIGRAWDPRLEGRYELLEGRAPADRSEIMATRSALARIGAEVGDSMTMTDPADTVRVVGVLESRLEPEESEHLFVSRDAAAADADVTTQGQTLWFAFDWSPTPDEVFALNADGIVVYARDLVHAPGEHASPEFDATSGSAWAMFSVAMAGLVFCVYIVLLLAGAAFSVSARRQQRALAITASVGAARGDVFRIVLLQGTLLGFAGGALGVAAGIGFGAAALDIFSDGSVYTGWGLHVPWLILVALVVFAGAVGTLAALMPARAATRGDVLAALRGARKPVSVDAKRPVWGLALMIAGLAIVVAGVIGLIAMYNAPGDPGAWGRQLAYAAGAIAMMVGPLLLQIGVILAGHWLIARLSRILSRIGLGARIASRDAVANPSRIVPSFGAIAACAFLAAAALGGTTLLVMSLASSTTYAAAPGDAYAYITTTEEDAAAVIADAEQLFDDAGAESTGVVETRHYGETAEESGRDLQAEAACDDDCVPAVPSWVTAAVVSADNVEAVLGQDVDDAILRDYAAGGAITTASEFLQDDDSIVLREWLDADLYAEDGVAESVARHEVAGAYVDIGRPAEMSVYLSPSAAADIGFATTPSRVVAHFEPGIAPAQSDQLTAGADTLNAQSQAAGSEAYVSPAVQQGPPQAGPWLALILGAVTVLVVGASAVALGLSRVERRADDATLTAVGASPQIRRSVSFWQALVVTGFGCVTGAVAGVIPALGAIMILDRTAGSATMYGELPWVLYGVLAVALPLAIAAVSWIIPPRAPDLTRRTAIA